jgi:hypothetical protein
MAWPSMGRATHDGFRCGALAWKAPLGARLVARQCGVWVARAARRPLIGRFESHCEITTFSLYPAIDQVASKPASHSKLFHGVVGAAV